MTQAHAEELKPSQLRTLEKTLTQLQEAQQVLEESPAAMTDQWRDDRARTLKKLTNTFKRAERTLTRLPESHGEVERGLATVESLQDRLAQALDELENAELAADAAQADALAQRLALLDAPETTDNIARIENLVQQFRHAWQSFTLINQRFTHGMYKYWDEESISQLAYTLEHREALIEEAQLLLEAYEPLVSTREGAVKLLTPMRDLKRDRDEFVQRLPEFIAAFPAVQEVTAEAFHAEVEKQATIFRNANKERDTSALLNLNPNFPQLDTERNRLRAQELVYQALSGPHEAEMSKLRKASLASADAVSEEIIGWQQAQQGREAEALAQQQAKYEAQSQRNAERAEADRLAWLERRKRLDAEREAQHQRNIELRKVTR